MPYDRKHRTNTYTSSWLTWAPVSPVSYDDKLQEAFGKGKVPKPEPDRTHIYTTSFASCPPGPPVNTFEAQPCCLSLNNVDSEGETKGKGGFAQGGWSTRLYFPCTYTEGSDGEKGTFLPLPPASARRMGTYDRMVRDHPLSDNLCLRHVCHECACDSWNAQSDVYFDRIRGKSEFGQALLFCLDNDTFEMLTGVGVSEPHRTGGTAGPPGKSPSDQNGQLVSPQCATTTGSFAPAPENEYESGCLVSYSKTVDTTDLDRAYKELKYDKTVTEDLQTLYEKMHRAARKLSLPPPASASDGVHAHDLATGQGQDQTVVTGRYRKFKLADDCCGTAIQWVVHKKKHSQLSVTMAC